MMTHLKRCRRNHGCSGAITILAIITAMCLSMPSAAWEHHPLITSPVVEGLAAADVTLQPAAAVPLEDFLMAVEEPLAVLLAEEEAWAQEHLHWHAPLPEALAFEATGDPSTIRDRFFRALRINPDTPTPLYLTVLSGTEIPGAALLPPEAVTLFPESTGVNRFDFVEVQPGGVLNALDIIATASNEPDFGMDTGLFEDNGTSFGDVYGFGNQPFGNPDLDYGSQAPFHMGFYHESPLVFLFARFLEKTYPEYRIRQFKRLSEFAFEHGQDYWGWRFMGWGLHYVGDLSMPYHATVLPGYSTLRMLWINFLDMVGFPTPVNNALQLVSNRHIAIERYQRIRMERAARHGEASIIYETLAAEHEVPSYSDDLPRTALARGANRMARRLDRAIVRYMPPAFVNDPSVEVTDEDTLEDIVDIIADEHGEAALAELDALIAEALELFAIYGRSYIHSILDTR